MPSYSCTLPCKHVCNTSCTCLHTGASLAATTLCNTSHSIVHNSKCISSLAAFRGRSLHREPLRMTCSRELRRERRGRGTASCAQCSTQPAPEAARDEGCPLWCMATTFHILSELTQFVSYFTPIVSVISTQSVKNRDNNRPWSVGKRPLSCINV